MTGVQTCALPIFVNENTGWVAGSSSYGGLYKTTNKGVEWVLQDSLSTYTYSTLFFIDENTGWAGDYLSKYLYHTTNGGANWEKIVKCNGLPTGAIQFVNHSTGWFVGGLGMIMKTTNGGTVFANNNSLVVPDGYELFQNYPNPFNPSTTIEYSISKESPVSIIVYDITGREVATLVNEVKRAGYYTVQFNASRLSSGIYFYRITAGDFISTRKMILLK